MKCQNNIDCLILIVIFLMQQIFDLSHQREEAKSQLMPSNSFHFPVNFQTCLCLVSEHKFGFSGRSWNERRQCHYLSLTTLNNEVSHLGMPLSICLFLSAALSLSAIWITSPSVPFIVHQGDSNQALGEAPHVRRRLATFHSKMWLTCFKMESSKKQRHFLWSGLKIKHCYVIDKVMVTSAQRTTDQGHYHDYMFGTLSKNVLLLFWRLLS